MNNETLPFSIRLIGWSSIIGSMLISVLIIISFFIILIFGGLADIEKNLKGLEYPFLKGLPFSVIGTIFLSLFYVILIGITGIFLLRKNLYAWVIVLILTSLGWIFSFIESFSKTDIFNGIGMLIGVFTMWKLYEHRKFFLDRKINVKS